MKNNPNALIFAMNHFEIFTKSYKIIRLSLCLFCDTAREMVCHVKKQIFAINGMCFENHDYEICPHSAISVCALRKLAPQVKTVCVATAHACKFEDVLIQANKKRPVYTPACEKILNLPEKVIELFFINVLPSEFEFVNMEKTENWEVEWIEILKGQVFAKNPKSGLRAKL